MPENTNGSGQLADEAYLLIRERILSGKYTFGMVISRRDLAKELGVSLVPINEAICRLENEYLIVNTPRVGTKVRVPTPQEIRGFWAVREGLETQAARLFAAGASDKERAELVELAQQLDLMHESSTDSEIPDPERLYPWRCAHMRFHMRIAECTRLPFLTRQVERNQILIFNWFYDHQLYGKRKEPSDWHEQLAHSLANEPPAEADAAMRKHLHNKVEDLMRSLERVLLMDETHLAHWNQPSSLVTAASAKK
ncbi:MAG: GntR family transcriptional regulator [Acidobacteriaceae bacterium]